MRPIGRLARVVSCLALSAAAMTSWSREAPACGGCFVPPPPAPTGPVQVTDNVSVITDEKMILSISMTQTTLYDEITYSGSPSSFAWVLPIKGTVTVGLSADILFQTMSALTAPTVTSPPPDCPPAPTCASPYSGGSSSPGCGSASVSVAIPSSSVAVYSGTAAVPDGIVFGTSTCSGDIYFVFGGGWGFCDDGIWDYTEQDPTGFGDYTIDTSIGGGGAAPAVTVTSQMQVGPYEEVQLKSTDGSALTAWLTGHGYDIPASTKPVIASYVSQGFDFLALKLIPGQGVQTMQPVRVTTQGASPSLPLHMVSVGAGPVTGITIWIVADARWEPSNFPTFVIEDAQLAWDWNTSSSNYETLRISDEAALNGRGWQIESALQQSQYAFNQALEANVAGDTNGVGGYAAATMPAPGSAGAADAGSGGDGGDDASEVPDTVSQAIASDVTALFAGIAGPNAFITRMRGDIAQSALTVDMALQASADPSQISNQYTTTQQVGEPLCEVFNSSCQATGSVPRSQAVAASSGGCNTIKPRGELGTTLAFVGALGGLVAVRARGRRRARLLRSD